MVVDGKKNIDAFWREVCSREMTHKVTHEVLGPERVSFIEQCLYPDGCQVMSAMTLSLHGGHIVEHVTQARDEVSCATSSSATPAWTVKFTHTKGRPPGAALELIM